MSLPLNHLSYMRHEFETHLGQNGVRKYCELICRQILAETNESATRKLFNYFVRAVDFFLIFGRYLAKPNLIM